MATIQWGSIVSDYGRIGISVNVAETSSTQATVTAEVWFWSKYSVYDSSNTYYFDWEKTTATTSKGSVSISHSVASGTGWSTSNQTKLGTFTKTYTRGTSDTSYNCAAKFTGIEADALTASSVMIATVSYTIPAKTSYTVSYNANGGSGAPSSQVKTNGVTLTLSSTTPTRTGYTFSKWNTKSDGTGTSYNAGGSYTANASVTLYAIWSARPSQSVYICDDGTVYARGYFTSTSTYIDNTGAFYAPKYTTGSSFYFASDGIVAKAFKEGTP